MSEHWDFYMCRVDNHPASIYLDMGIAKKAPLKNFIWMAYIRLYMLNPRSDGLSSGDEFQILCDIEDQLEKELCCPDSSLYVGRNTSEGCRDFYFYRTDDKGWDKQVEAALSAFPKYSYEVGTRNDPDWETYHNFLYPGETDIQVMGDRSVLEQLEKRGDKLAEPREIAHWIYFPSMLARQAFEVKVKALDFKTLNYIEPENENPDFGICIARVDLPSHEEISNVTLPLFHLAKEYNGRYDGWETQVIT